MKRTRVRERGFGSAASRGIVAALLGLVIGGLLGAPAQASPETLRRSFSNLFNGPLDIAISPVVAGYTLANNLQDIDDTPGVRVAYALPGWIWLSALDAASGAIRTLTGVLEFLPGIGLFAFESDLDPLFDPVEDAGALVEWDNPLADAESPWLLHNPLVAPFAIRVKFGINYTIADY